MAVSTFLTITVHYLVFIVQFGLNGILLEYSVQANDIYVHKC